MSFEDILRRLRIRLRRMLRDRARVRRRRRRRLRKLVPADRKALSLRLRGRSVLWWSNRRNVRHRWNGTNRRRLTRDDDLTHSLNRYDLSALDVLGRTLLRRRSQDRKEQQREQRMQKQRREEASSQSLRIPAVQRIALEFQGRELSALNRAQEPAVK